jgi:hypothetical protein
LEKFRLVILKKMAFVDFCPQSRPKENHVITFIGFLFAVLFEQN